MRLPILCAALLSAACAQQPARPTQAEQAERLNASGTAAMAAGRPRAAAARYAGAAELSAGMDDRAGLARDLHNRGMALAAAGELDAARSDLAESARLADAVGAPAADRAATLLALASVQQALGLADAAQASIGRACGEADQAGIPGLRARCLASRAALAMRRDDLDAAARDLDLAAPLCGDDRAAAGSVAANRGGLALLRKDPAAAQAAYAIACVAFREAGDASGLAASLEGQARAAEAAGDRPSAAAAWRRAAAVPHGGEAARQRRLEQARRLAP